MMTLDGGRIGIRPLKPLELRKEHLMLRLNT